MEINIPENAIPDKTFNEKMEQIFINGNDVIIDDNIEETVQYEELNEDERRYNLDVQANDMLDQLLSIIPFDKRTPKILDNINRLIKRFKELRNSNSKFDSNNIVVDSKSINEKYKPLVENLKNLKFLIKWIIPVVSNKRELYNMTDEEIVDNKLLEEINQHK